MRNKTDIKNIFKNTLNHSPNIKKRISEHERDIRLNKGSTPIAQISQRENMKINFKTLPKLANYVNENLALKREAVEILSCKHKLIQEVSEHVNM